VRGLQVLLFRLHTGAGWNDVLDACSVQPPHCDPHHLDLPNGNCGDPTSAKLFFSSFVLCSRLILVNMFIAIVLENLEQVCRPQSGLVACPSALQDAHALV
jgi:hypothetical protein